MTTEFLMALISLLGVIGLIFLTYFGSKWLNKKFRFGSFNGADKGIKVIGCVGIAQDKQLIVVTVGKKNLLLGVTPAAVTKICDLDDDDISDFISSSENTDSSFFSNLKKALADNAQNKNSYNNADATAEKDGQDSKNEF